MKRRLFIIGAGGMGRELESILDAIPRKDTDWELAGYLHSGPDTLSAYPSDYTIVGDWNTFDFQSRDLVLMGTSDAVWKKKIAEALKERVEFLTFVHPGVSIGKFARIGKGCVIYPGAFISTNVRIGDFCTVNAGTFIGHDVQIGNFSSLMAHVDLGGWSQLGENVFMGTQSVLTPKKKIADNAQIAAGTVVMRHVKANTTMFGNPAVEL